VREQDVLERIRAIFDATSAHRGIVVGNGDDGAVLSLSDQTVLSTDMAVEGVHFRVDWSSPKEIGRKITAANLADICAMGGWPEFLLVAVAFPSRHLHLLEELARGIAHEADKVGARVIGGDLSQGSELVISITAIGTTEKPIRRSGAKVGDAVVISHLPGSSAAGLSLLSKGKEIDSESAREFVAQHCAPSIDYVKYRKAFPKLNCATDISDGLIVDAAHIASASSVAIELDTKNLTTHAHFEKLLTVFDGGDSALQAILTGGEDHVLLATTREPEKIEGFIPIGTVVSGHGIFVDGKRREMESGYQHSW
jgi:thiamine-monophosphate kinase